MERVIGQLKSFKILQQILTIIHVDLIDKVLVVVSTIMNLNQSDVN